MLFLSACSTDVVLLKLIPRPPLTAITARGQIIVGTMLPILTAVFNLKSQMLGGSPSGLVQEEILNLVGKMSQPVQTRPSGTQDSDDELFLPGSTTKM